MNPNLALPILADVLNCLAQNGDSTPLTGIWPVGGGCIHRVYRVDTGKRSYLLKWNPQPLPDIFEVEARGLKLLDACGAVRVPQVIASNRQPDFLLLEWIDAGTAGATWRQELLGTQLATLHRRPAGDRYGLDHDNFIGASVQVNAWHSGWPDFFRDCRLVPQMKMAIQNGALDSPARKKLDWICAHLDRWIDPRAGRPSLLHGDLWAGNVISAPGGQPVLIDPAVYYGDREAELAFTGLFGGFSDRFYRAYHDAWPLDAGYRERWDLYNLYHLLNHLNLFGEGYLGAVEAVIDRYASG